MIDLTTVKELRALRLPGMARELESQLEDPQRYKTLSFEDRLALLIDAESVSRRKNTIQRRIHEARLSESQACVEAIEYHEDRELDKGLITKLATCAYIRDNHHVVLKGATGAGKSYIANALGVAACRQLYKVRYGRMPGLLNEYAVAKSLNTQNKVKKAYARFDLLIIDEWLLRPLPESEAYDLLELIDACSRKGALILCTQYDVDDWYYRIDCDRAEDEGSAVAEGILDRIINNKYSIEVKGRISMRKRHAFSDEVYTAFLDAIKTHSVRYDDKTDKNIKIIYSPLNGTGLKPITRILQEEGYTDVTVVKEQEQPDGNFPTCPYPNPELKEAMFLSLEYAKKMIQI